MSDDLRFDGKVAIVTGAGNGLGRAHALLLAARGAKVVVNDLGSSIHGGGRSSAAADAVVAQIKEAGGEAIANYDSVEDGGEIVKSAIEAFGRIDVLVNNAGILRDTTFAKMSDDDWKLIQRVHLDGAYKCTAAAWPLMRDQGFGRIVFTASAAGIYGNFGQANYAAAKLGLVGFSNTLALEGRKRGIHVNVIAPIAGSRLTETVLPKELLDALKPEYVSPLVAWLCHESCTETGGLFEVGGGFVGKLRWERTKGKVFKLGRAITPEQIQRAWPEITSFERSEHPTDITSSMQPILGNLQSKAKGGNDLIDVDEALGFEFPPIDGQYDEREASLYALSIGAGRDPDDRSDLKYLYEGAGEGFQVFPTFGVIPVIKVIMEMAKSGQKAPGLNYGFDRILHGAQRTEIKRPLPPNAKLRHRAKIKEIWDKGRHAIVVQSVVTEDATTGEELVTNEFTTFVRGAGGWGGERGPSDGDLAPPERAPDATITEKTREDQALLYRLTGDWNPLHVDPDFAKAFGFRKPILHGLCTYGFVARHVVKQFAGNDGRLLASIQARFAESVYPGETLETQMWKEGSRILVRCRVVERDAVVITNCAVELHAEVPKPKAVVKAAPAANAASSASAAIFQAIGAFVARSPDLVAKVGKVYRFDLTGASPSSWTLDLVKGAVSAGNHGKADCTLELADSDFVDLALGKADAQKLYFAGKVKIGGDVMASQKLQKVFAGVDPKAVEAAVAGSAAPAIAGSAAPASVPAAQSAPGSAEIFRAMGVFLEGRPEIAQKVQTTYLFRLKDPDSAWTVDLKAGKVTPGESGAECVLELAEVDFLALTAGKADPQKLYFGGRLKISGNVMASQKLEILFKAMTPDEAKKALEAARASGPQAAPATSATEPAARSAEAKAIFAKIEAALRATPALAQEVGAAIQVHVTEPSGAWILDLRAAPSVREGTLDGATTTLRIADEDLAQFVRGAASLQSLHQKGKLRIDGDVRVVHRLGFLSKIG